MKNIWLILPVSIMVLFVSLSNIEPMVTDSGSYLVFGGLRPPLYPLLFKIFGQYIIVLQSALWLATAYIILRKTNALGMILYCSSIGLLFLSQKVLTETVFVFMIAMAVMCNKNWSFFWLCLTMLIKPVMILFIPFALIFMKPKYTSLGLFFVGVGISYVLAVSVYLGDRSWDGIWTYLVTTGTNCIGKTVGVEGMFLQRITQLQTLSCAVVGFAGILLLRKNILCLLPIYLILMSGFAPNQGDRLIIISVPICIIILMQWIKQKKL